MPDLIDRLTDANPVTEATSAPAEADALLARILAEPPPRTHPSRSLLRPLGATAAVACAAAVAVAVIDIAGSDDADGGVIDRAVAAATERDAIYHVVERFTARYEAEDPRALDAFDSGDLDMFENDVYFSEYWYGPGEGGRMLVYGTEGSGRGELRAEAATLDDTRSYYYDARSNRVSIACAIKKKARRRPPVPPPGETLPEIVPGEDAGPQLRALHEQGRLRVADTVEVDGREAYLLRSDVFRGTDPGHTERIDYLVDAETYLLIEQRQVSTQKGVPGLPRNEYSDVLVTGTFTREFLTYERLPVTGENLESLKPTPRPGVEVSDHGCG